jgi:heme o synthase
VASKLKNLSPSLSKYYRLTKPGIVYGNLLPAVAGYLLASSIKQQFLAIQFGATLAGLGLIIASACVANNILDRHLDTHMQRTKKRATVTGAISIPRAAIVSLVFLVVGASVLYSLSGALALYLALLGHVLYVVVYGYAKRHTVRSTEIGALSGAMPPLVGYTAVAPEIDATVLSLFFILCAWQMAHFYAIALYRRKEYERAHIYLFPSRFGTKKTKQAIIIYLFILLLTLLMPYALGAVGIFYACLVGGWTSYWIYAAIKKFSQSSDTWAQWVFKQSLFGLLVYSFALSTGALLP